MFDMNSGNCADCAVTNCADCSDAVGTCKTCMTGYKLDGSGNCALDTDNLPCASGYSMKEGVCTACPAGCSSCNGNDCTSCIDGIMWGTSSSAAAD